MNNAPPRRRSTADLPSPVAERLARLAPDQRAAATAPPGPALCVAPAGSGKTTTLVARVAWLIGGPVAADPATICAITFNKRAQEELAARLVPALEPLGAHVAAEAGDRRPGLRVRTFHALGREILRDAGVAAGPLIERDGLLRELFPRATHSDRRRLDDAFSRLKLDLRVTPAEIAASSESGPVAHAFVAYEEALATLGGLDFDDLVARALTTLEGDDRLLARWRARTAHLLVDEAQDVDRSQLTLALLLAAPANRIFLVGDDDQSIYGWRLADVRRVLGLAAELPGLLRVDLVTNYRCPGPVVERAVRLVERNEERFAKRIEARPGAPGRLILAPDPGEETTRIGAVFDRMPDDGTRAILARTNRELLPAVALALERGLPFRAQRMDLLLDLPTLEELLVRVEAETGPLLIAIERLRRALAEDEDATRSGTEVGAEPAGITPEADRLMPARLGARNERDTATPDRDDADAPRRSELASALLSWAPGFADAESFVRTVRARRDALEILCRDDAPLAFATAHSTKGLEFDHVAVIGMDAARFPSARALADHPEPVRALEEERRLAYVAWTRARRSLTLVYDPAAPSQFLVEAFSAEELGATIGR